MKLKYAKNIQNISSDIRNRPNIDSRISIAVANMYFYANTSMSITIKKSSRQTLVLRKLKKLQYKAVVFNYVGVIFVLLLFLIQTK